MNFIHKYSRQLLILLVLGLLAGAGFVWVIFGRTATNKQPVINTVSPRPSDSTKPLTASGVAVPTAWQTRARSLGYYCPSWAAKPGEIVSSVCLPLDK